MLYTPSIKDSIPLEGYLFDMRLFAKLPSIQELKFAKPASTEQKPYYSETKIEQYQYNLVSENFPHKLLEIYFSEGLNGEKKYKFSVPLFHRKPHQEVNLLEILTNNPSLVQNGTHIWGKCSLSADDSISFFMAAYEEGYQQFSDIANLVEYRSLVTLTANEPHTFSLPDNTQAYSFKCRGAGQIGWGIGKAILNWIDPTIIRDSQLDGPGSLEREVDRPIEKEGGQRENPLPPAPPPGQPYPPGSGSIISTLEISGISTSAFIQLSYPNGSLNNGVGAGCVSRIYVVYSTYVLDIKEETGYRILSAPVDLTKERN
ncbi:hypothetical protein NG798_01430 [Ancylothrix sp. C2]|uniref:hypothetical protein n=1 Tax=Ancylothrix sp. D3o TaxID=2953691 RepID=UPI0021BA6515|nr:hypothetical protein [Ancylothrix sp. D3o]MCT7948441.1 hypothetical protein [Ancylothrix sp. D3o]